MAMRPHTSRTTKILIMMNMARMWLMLLLLLALSANLKAQQGNIRFERLSIEQGLSQSSVRCIKQDHQGFIWFGSEDGLNKYDGYTFTIYRNRFQDDTSLSNNTIIAIHEDRLGYLWIGTAGGGLNRFDPNSQTFTTFRNDPKDANSISSNYIRAIYEDRSGMLWIA